MLGRVVEVVAGLDIPAADEDRDWYDCCAGWWPGGMLVARRHLLPICPPHLARHGEGAALTTCGV